MSVVSVGGGVVVVLSMVMGVVMVVVVTAMTVVVVLLLLVGLVVVVARSAVVGGNPVHFAFSLKAHPSFWVRLKTGLRTGHVGTGRIFCFCFSTYFCSCNERTTSSCSLDGGILRDDCRGDVDTRIGAWGTWTGLPPLPPPPSPYPLFGSLAFPSMN